MPPSPILVGNAIELANTSGTMMNLSNSVVWGNAGGIKVFTLRWSC